MSSAPDPDYRDLVDDDRENMHRAAMMIREAGTERCGGSAPFTRACIVAPHTNYFFRIFSETLTLT